MITGNKIGNYWNCLARRRLKSLIIRTVYTQAI